MQHADGADPAESHGGASVLVRNGVRRTLFAMAWPMLAGTFAWNAYSITDAWFIGGEEWRRTCAFGCPGFAPGAAALPPRPGLTS